LLSKSTSFLQPRVDVGTSAVVKAPLPPGFLSPARASGRAIFDAFLCCRNSIKVLSEGFFFFRGALMAQEMFLFFLREPSRVSSSCFMPRLFERRWFLVGDRLHFHSRILPLLILMYFRAISMPTFRRNSLAAHTFPLSSPLLGIGVEVEPFFSYFMKPSLLHRNWRPLIMIDDPPPPPPFLRKMSLPEGSTRVIFFASR